MCANGDIFSGSCLVEAGGDVVAGFVGASRSRGKRFTLMSELNTPGISSTTRQVLLDPLRSVGRWWLRLSRDALPLEYSLQWVAKIRCDLQGKCDPVLDAPS